MQLEILGNWAGAPGADGACSGYLVTEGSTKLLLDCGPGVVPALQRKHRCSGLAAIFITHMHADHCLDLLTLAYRLIRFDWRFSSPRSGGERRIPLSLPPGGKRVLGALVDALGRPEPSRLADPFASAFDVEEREPQGALRIGSLTLSWLPMHHPISCQGVRVQSDSGVVAYSGDTALGPELVELASQADLLLCEATERDPQSSTVQRAGHLTAAQAGSVARAARAQRLLLTHLNRQDPEWCAALVSDALDPFVGPVAIAKAGAVYRLVQIDSARPAISGVAPQPA